MVAAPVIRVPVARVVGSAVAASVVRVVAPVTRVSSWAGLAARLPAGVANLYPSVLPVAGPNLLAVGGGRQGLSSSRTFAPGSLAPVPGGVPFGSGVSSAAGAGSGFFFSGAAVAPALSALYVPHVSWTLRTFARSRALEPFVLLLERPG